MGLIKCPDCAKFFSERIRACPNCGCPIEEAIKEMQKETKEENANQSSIEENNEISLLPSPSPTPEAQPKFSQDSLMTRAELEDFAFHAILPTIKKELGGEVSKVERNEDEEDGVDYYLMVGTQIIGLDVVVDVAPCFKYSICNWTHAEQMYNKGYKYAVAHIGIGAKDKLRFEKRFVLCGDTYLFQYENLKFFDYGERKNIRFSLSPMDYSFIYEDESKKVSPYAIQKEIPSYRSMFVGESFEFGMQEYWKMYSLPKETLAFHMEYIKELASAISYKLPLKETILNFWYGVSYCKGFLFADSQKVAKRKIIPSCYELLDSNRSIKLGDYDKYTFAYFIYYYLTNGEYTADCESAGYLNQKKIKLFEENPAYFGFESLAEDRRGKNKINSAEYIYQMEKMIQDFLEVDYSQYINLHLEINRASSRKLIDFPSYHAKFKELLNTSNKTYHFLMVKFDSSKPFYKKELYLAFKLLNWEYKELLEMDCPMFEKLAAKSTGRGKYGFFAYRKDKKDRESHAEKLVPLYEDLKRDFSMKTVSEKTKMMVAVYSELVMDISEEYLQKVKGNNVLYSEFREKLCEFHTRALTFAFEKEYEEERKYFIMCVANFIELIELQEQIPIDEDLIVEEEEKLLKQLEIIKSKMYRALI